MLFAISYHLPEAQVRVRGYLSAADQNIIMAVNQSQRLWQQRWLFLWGDSN